ncbi:DUF6210 family protein [Kitasatospora sp. NPDC086791]|uniref:DUF6210 family protein n=1 Tax=Kitasatospora sp. NPDC086791 TaxID=3155178 RepID=UPI00344489C8
MTDRQPGTPPPAARGGRAARGGVGRVRHVDELARLRSAVEDLGIYGAGRDDETYSTSLVLDGSRLAEPAEAWVPVVTPDGPLRETWIR